MQDVFIETMNLTLPRKYCLTDTFVTTSVIARALLYTLHYLTEVFYCYQLCFDKTAVLVVTTLLHSQFLASPDAFPASAAGALFHTDAGVARNSFP